MDYEYNNNPIYGIVWFIIVGIIFYLLCSLCSWSLSMAEWGLFSNIIKWIGYVIEFLIAKEVLLQFFGFRNDSIDDMPQNA